MARPMTILTYLTLLVVFAVSTSAQQQLLQPLQSENSESESLQYENSESELPALSEETAVDPVLQTVQSNDVPLVIGENQNGVRNRRTFGSIYFSKGYHHGYYRPRYYHWTPSVYSYYRPYYYTHYW